MLLATTFMPGVAKAKVVDLRVLVISTGEDVGLKLIDDVLEQMGVPYDAFDQAANEGRTDEAKALNAAAAYFDQAAQKYTPDPAS